MYLEKLSHHSKIGIVVHPLTWELTEIIPNLNVKVIK